MNRIAGSHDILFVVLDTLRFDVADRLMRAGRTPHLGRAIGGIWEKRLSPACFTYAAHHAFFAGFLPVPVDPGVHGRLFACAFEGSRTIVPQTKVFDAPDIVHGFAEMGYRTVVIGGVGFFNPATPLGRTLPGFFQEAHWDPSMGVTDPRSTENQFTLAARILDATPRDRRVFLFINASAIHQPNRHYSGATEDDLESHGRALEYVDASWPILDRAIRSRPRVFGIVCSDHGTAYGEDGYRGHRVPHEVVSTVPYGEIIHGADLSEPPRGEIAS
jgi:hypothetical protein